MKERVKVGITKEAYEKIQHVDFSCVVVKLKALRCESNLDDKTEKGHCAILDIELPQEENQMNIDKVETQTEHQEEMSAFSCENEWNGEGLPPVGVECDFFGVDDTCNGKVDIYHIDDNKVMFLGRIEGYPSESTINNFKEGRDLMAFYVREGDRAFRKPETPQQRERLEAAYDLYTHVQRNSNRPSCDIESLGRMENESPLYTLIVDKTNYRKGVK